MAGQPRSSHLAVATFAAELFRPGKHCYTLLPGPERLQIPWHLLAGSFDGATRPGASSKLFHAAARAPSSGSAQVATSQPEPICPELQNLTSVFLSSFHFFLFCFHLLLSSCYLSAAWG